MQPVCAFVIHCGASVALCAPSTVFRVLTAAAATAPAPAIPSKHTHTQYYVDRINVDGAAANRAMCDNKRGQTPNSLQCDACYRNLARLFCDKMPEKYGLYA